MDDAEYEMLKREVKRLQGIVDRLLANGLDVALIKNVRDILAP